MSKKIDQFYFEHGNFRGILQVLSSFNVPRECVTYDPTLGSNGQLVVKLPSGETNYYDVGSPYWLKNGKPDDSILRDLEKKPVIIEPTKE